MDTETFWLVFCIGDALVFLQGVAAYADGFLTHAQMQRVHKIPPGGGYSFFDQGGMWSDVIIITPLVAYLIATYSFACSPVSVFLFVIALLLWAFLAQKMFVPMGASMPEAHARNGYITLAGWIHVVYAGLTTSVVASGDIWMTSFLLRVWAFFGVVKFSSPGGLTSSHEYRLSARSFF